MADIDLTKTTLAKRLTAQDSSFLYAESLNGPLHIGTLTMFAGEIPFEKLFSHFQGRLHLIPRYRQKLRFEPFSANHPAWEDDANFRLENHVKRHQLPKGTTEADAIRAALDVHEVALDRNKPVWEVHSFEGVAGNKTLLLWKTHHCMIDGVSGVELLEVALDFRPDAPPLPPPEQPWNPKPEPNLFTRFADAILDGAQVQLNYFRHAIDAATDRAAVREQIKHLAAAAGSLFRMATRPLVSAPWATRLVSKRRTLAYSKYEFRDFRNIRTRLGGTVNDVVLTILSEAAARYLDHHEYTTKGRQMRIGCPVNVRKKAESGALGNRVSMMFPELPAEPMNVVDRLQAVIKETERVKASMAPQGLALGIDAAELASPAVTAGFGGIATRSLDYAVSLQGLLPTIPARPSLTPPGLGMSFLATNVPGVMVPEYLAGHECLEMIGLVPLAANMGYGVAILSYNGKLFVGMMAEPHNMPDVDLMKAFADSAFDELKAAAEAVKLASDEAARKSGTGDLQRAA